jgi:hypothetical protein
MKSVKGRIKKRLFWKFFDERTWGMVGVEILGDKYQRTHSGFPVVVDNESDDEVIWVGFRSREEYLKNFNL